jgi:tryptophan synthase alpha chain
VNTLERHLRHARSEGRGLLVPYVTGGITDDWTDLLLASQEAGADAIEIGLPFSDPTLDGRTVQQASHLALSRGATPEGVLEQVRGLDLQVPLAVMTYTNIVLRPGAEKFCAWLREAGVSGLIVPDLPVDESSLIGAAAAHEGIDQVLLAAPATGPERLALIAARSKGFVYAVSRMGTTGEHSDPAETGHEPAASLRGLTDLPVLLGFGISDPQQAAAARNHADGVVVGSALMRKVLDGAGPKGVGAFLTRLRRALDTF